MKNKKVYKLLNENTGRYVKGNASKSFWTSINWVVNKLVEMSTGRIISSTDLDALKNDKFVIEEYEWVLTNRYSGKELLDAKVNEEIENQQKLERKYC